MLWTDDKSREFIANEYPWFLSTFESYVYPIQRADAIRYFVLYHYGGVYLDLDVGCLRPLDPLLVYPVVLPKTIPVGVSNDLMFAAKGHPFMAQTIHNLITFDHDWFLNYPTVMFSTGPMFLSMQYGMYTSAHPVTDALPGGEVRILSKPLYGKNAKEGEAPHAFFSHHYGSSWHSDDAAFITFLGKWGKFLMKVGLVFLFFGILRMYTVRRRSHGSLRRRLAFTRYDLLLPRTFHDRNGNPHIGLDLLDLNSGSTTGPSSPGTTPPSSVPPSPSTNPMLLPLPYDLRPVSPALSTASASSAVTETTAAISAATAQALRRAGTWAVSVPSFIASGRSSSRSRDTSTHTTRNRSIGNRSFVAYLPALFTPAPDQHRASASRRETDDVTLTVPPSRIVVPQPHRPRGQSFTPASGSASSSKTAAARAKAQEAGVLIPEILENESDVQVEVESEEEQRTPSPMLIDPLGGSDVRTTRSASVSIAEGLPPPYRAARSTVTTANPHGTSQNLL